MMRNFEQLPDLKGKQVLLRADFDVPVAADGRIGEPFRIERQKKAVDALLDQGARVALIAHIGATPSFEPLVPELSALLGREIVFVKNAAGLSAAGASLALSENVRHWPGEETNDEQFARELAKGFDLYVNNAFAVCHRAHASVSAIASILPAYAGPLIKEETEQLQTVLNTPAQGKVVIMGGAKASTKIPVIKHLLDKAERILVGGVIANDMAKALGRDVGQSIVDPEYQELLAGLDFTDARLVIPEDFVESDSKFLDIGAKTVERFIPFIENAQMIVWNGPLGMFEDERFRSATTRVAHAIVDSGALSIMGGGDTIAAVRTLGLLERFSFVSTGGGAMLAFLAGECLPGLQALGYYS